jgi:hypothetical protein
MWFSIEWPQPSFLLWYISQVSLQLHHAPKSDHNLCLLLTPMDHSRMVRAKKNMQNKCCLFTNTSGFLSRPCPIILTETDTGPNKLVANATPYSTCSIQHIPTWLFHKEALHRSSQSGACDHYIRTTQC